MDVGLAELLQWVSGTCHLCRRPYGEPLAGRHPFVGAAV